MTQTSTALDPRAAILVHLESVLVSIEPLRIKAKIMAASHPASFFVMTGTTLPEYERQLDELRDATKLAIVKLKEEAQEDEPNSVE